MSVRAKKQIKKVVEYLYDGIPETTKEFFDNLPKFYPKEYHERLSHVECKCDGKQLIIKAWPEYKEDLEWVASFARECVGYEGWGGL